MVQFDRRFGVGEKLRTGWPGYRAAWGCEGKEFDCLLTDKVFNLVTKERYNDKPTYDSVRGTLEMMCCMCLEKGIRKVAMPKLNSGLDWPSWMEVLKIIRQKFAGSGIEIMICMSE